MGPVCTHPGTDAAEAGVEVIGVAVAVEVASTDREHKQKSNNCNVPEHACSKDSATLQARSCGKHALRAVMFVLHLCE